MAEHYGAETTVSSGASRWSVPGVAGRDVEMVVTGTERR